MSFSNCETKCNCTGIAFVASLIIGIIAAFLQITATIALTPVILQSAIIIALSFLAITLLSVSLTKGATSCFSLCSVISTLLLGILGSILFAIILLVVDLAATSIVSAIFVGLLVFSFALLLTSVACLIKCSVRCGD